MFQINTTTKKFVEAVTLDLGQLPTTDTRIDLALTDGTDPVQAEGHSFTLAIGTVNGMLYKTDANEVSFRYLRFDDDNVGATKTITMTRDGVEILSDSISLTYQEAGGGSVTVDTSLSSTSPNPVANATLTPIINGKAESSALATVATTGNYNDLSNKPTIPEAQVNADWSASSGVAQILNKPLVTSDLDYFCVSADASTTDPVSMRWDIFNPNQAPTLEYSLDRATWSTYTFDSTTGQTIAFQTLKGSVWFRGTGTQIGRFQGTLKVTAGKVDVSGNLMSLLDPTCTSTAITSAYCFTHLFNECFNLIDASGLRMPAQLGEYAIYTYFEAFKGCSNMLRPPQVLPAVTVPDHAYAAMFEGCSKITQTPEIKAVAVNSCGMDAMFYGCSELTEATLHATWIGSLALRAMFYNCTKLSKLHVEFTAWNDDNAATLQWLFYTPQYGVFECPSALPDPNYRNPNYIPSDWTIIRYDALNADWSEVDPTENSFIKNKPSLATVATTGSYNDLSNKPTIPSAITVDSALSTSSVNPVQNNVITSAINAKVDKIGQYGTVSGACIDFKGCTCSTTYNTQSNVTYDFKAYGSETGTITLPVGEQVAITPITFEQTIDSAIDIAESDNIGFELAFNKAAFSYCDLVIVAQLYKGNAVIREGFYSFLHYAQAGTNQFNPLLLIEMNNVIASGTQSFASGDTIKMVIKPYVTNVQTSQRIANKQAIVVWTGDSTKLTKNKTTMIYGNIDGLQGYLDNQLSPYYKLQYDTRQHSGDNNTIYFLDGYIYVNDLTYSLGANTVFYCFANTNIGFVFRTDSNFSYTFESNPSYPLVVNKQIDFKPNKIYMFTIYYNMIFWQELEEYVDPSSSSSN